MCLDSALDLWPPGHFELGFFASRIRRSEMECSALGFSYVRWKPRNEQLAQMGSFHQSKFSDNKQYAVEARWGIFFENLTYFLFLRAVVNIPIQTLIIPPWPLLRKMITSQLELGSPVRPLAFFFSTQEQPCSQWLVLKRISVWSRKKVFLLWVFRTSDCILSSLVWDEYSWCPGWHHLN